MTALQMNAELFRAMSEIADDEALMAKLLKYARKLAKKKEDPTLMSKEEFFRRIDEAEKEIAEGKCTRFSDPVVMEKWLNAL